MTQARDNALALPLDPLVRETLFSNDTMEQVIGFHTLFNAPQIGTLDSRDPNFSHMSSHRVAVRVDFIVEELLELLKKGLGIDAELILSGRDGIGYTNYTIPALVEQMRASEKRDGVEVVDALGDIVYVCYGLALELGYDLRAVLSEIHAANLTKAGSDGRPIVNGETEGYLPTQPGFLPDKPMGKVVKSANYVEPDIAGVLGVDG